MTGIVGIHRHIFPGTGAAFVVGVARYFAQIEMSSGKRRTRGDG